MSLAITITIALVILAALAVARDAFVRWIAHRETMRLEQDYRDARATFETDAQDGHRDHERRIIVLERRATAGVRRP